MALTPLTPRQRTTIVNNVVQAVKDITKLKNSTYKYLYLCSGFIAHYDRYGFIQHYQGASLRKDLLANASSNKWSNFRPGDENYEYYRSKAEVYSAILAKIA